MIVVDAVLLLLVLEQERNAQERDLRHQQRAGGDRVAPRVDAPACHLLHGVLLASQLRVEEGIDLEATLAAVLHLLLEALNLHLPHRLGRRAGGVAQFDRLSEGGPRQRQRQRSSNGQISQALRHDLSSPDTPALHPFREGRPASRIDGKPSVGEGGAACDTVTPSVPARSLITRTPICVQVRPACGIGAGGPDEPRPPAACAQVLAGPNSASVAGGSIHRERCVEKLHNSGMTVAVVDGPDVFLRDPGVAAERGDHEHDAVGKAIGVLLLAH